MEALSTSEAGIKFSRKRVYTVSISKSGLAMSCMRTTRGCTGWKEGTLNMGVARLSALPALLWM